MENKIINSNYNGVLVVRAKNALFNSGFDGLPRTLPDGTIFATDKALKYCIREYLALFKEKSVFVRRNREFSNLKNEKNKLSYDTLEENFKKKTNLQKIPDEDKEVVNLLRSFIDVRMFGVVFAVNQNISLTGPVQISYGVNKLIESSAFSSDILSPYADKSPVQTTIGNETRTDEVFYVYDISVNKNNAQGILGTEMTEDDLLILKESLINGVDLITSTTKFGVESVALLWVKNEKNQILNNLNDFVKIKRENKPIIDLKELITYLKSEGINDSDIEIKSKENKIYIEK
jgi:CRISPR-associated protein Csh2